MGTSLGNGSGPVSAADLRFLTYSHDGFGLGHFRRSLRLASALVALSPGTSVLAATGSSVPQYLKLPEGVDYLKIPSVAKAGPGKYVPRSLSVPPQDLLDVRAAVLAACFESWSPDLVLVDRYPLGLLGELRPALETLRTTSPQTKVVLGLRDVIDDPETVKDEWRAGGYAEALEEFYDLVLIYGSRSIYDAVDIYGFPQPVADRTVYTGYLCEAAEPGASAKVSERNRTNGHRLALCTVGGGEDGFAVAGTFIETMHAMGEEWTAVVVTGPLMSRENARQLKAAARNGDGRIRVQRYAKDLPAFIEAADVVVSMGGYNTLSEALSVAARTVVVPRARPRTEQTIRARLFAERGVVRVVPESELAPESLMSAIRDAAEVPRSEIGERVAASFDLAGLAHAAEAMMTLIGNGHEDFIDLRDSMLAGRKAAAEKAAT